MPLIHLDDAIATANYQQISQSRLADLCNDLVSSAIRFAELPVGWQQSATIPNVLFRKGIG